MSGYNLESSCTILQENFFDYNLKKPATLASLCDIMKFLKNKK